jgi:hypothetical protein
MSEETKAPHVYMAIAEVMGELAKVGISKDNKNTSQNYKFRGIDDVYNALAPHLARAKLLILPRVQSRIVTERETQKGGVLFYVVLDVEFDFVSAIDGSKHVVRVVGEAMDSGDKATNKAMSAAYKYACMEAFCIPTEGDNDADATTREGVKPAAAILPHGFVPSGFEDWLTDLTATADNGTEALQKAWKASHQALRKHLLDTNTAGWEALKSKASKVKQPEAVPA